MPVSKRATSAHCHGCIIRTIESIVLISNDLVLTCWLLRWRCWVTWSALSSTWPSWGWTVLRWTPGERESNFRDPSRQDALLSPTLALLLLPGHRGHSRVVSQAPAPHSQVWLGLAAKNSPKYWEDSLFMSSASDQKITHLISGVDSGPNFSNGAIYSLNKRCLDYKKWAYL